MSFYTIAGVLVIVIVIIPIICLTVEYALKNEAKDIDESLESQDSIFCAIFQLYGFFFFKVFRLVKNQNIIEIKTNGNFLSNNCFMWRSLESAYFCPIN